MKSLFSKFKSNTSDSRSSSRANSAASSTKENKENVSTTPSTKKKFGTQPLKRIISKSHLVENPSSSSSSSTSPPPPPRTLTPIANQHISSSTTNLIFDDNVRPHSVNGPISNSHLSPVVGWDEGEGINRNRTVSASGDIHNINERGGGGKKVTFRSPAPTPTTSVLLDDAINIEDDERERGSSKTNGSGIRESSISASPSKRASTSALKPPSSSLSTQVPYPRPGTSQSTNSVNLTNRPRPTSRQTSPFLPSLAIRPTAFRKASLPPLTSTGSRPNSTSTSTSPTKTSMVISPTPSESSTGAMSNLSYLPQPNSWSEMAEDDLIANLGPKERTRQEVLWEIVSSEERYVQDLIKFNETFCKALLPLSANSPHLDLYDHTPSFTRTMSPSSPLLSGNESSVNLPIAAKYSSITPRFSGSRYPSDSSTSTAPPMTPNEDTISGSKGTLSPPPISNSARMNAYNILTNGKPPKHKSSFSSLNFDNGNKRSHNSLPPPVTMRLGSNSSQSNLNPTENNFNQRLSYHPGFSGNVNGIHNKLYKANSRVSSGGSTTSLNQGLDKNVKLPEELEKVLTVLSGGILEGHIKLAAALKRRYENQYPLVRSLADVFTAHSYILREYSVYVLNLEKALSQVDSSLSLFTDTSSHKTKRTSKKLDDSELGKISRKLIMLEELASEKGEAGLIISLSKPFQRLLKYPLLFQNLLFNTDPSLKEYESTLSMVDKVEEILRFIEDEKFNEEERLKTRDCWARIDGLERDKVIMAPKSNRLLISETKLPVPEDVNLKIQKDLPSSVKGKKSFKRLSDILKGGSDGELWVLRFSDVSLLCEKTGVTHLPIASFKKATKSDSSGDLNNKKNGTMGKRSASIRARNLYRFVKVHEWHLKSKTGSTDALLNMQEISASRQQPEIPQSPPPAPTKYPTLPSIAGTPHATPTKVPMKTMDGSSNPSPSKSFRSRKAASGGGGDDDDMMSVISDGISEMSFAFKDGDQVKPNLKVKSKPQRQSLPSARPTSINRTIGNTPTSPNGKLRITSQPGLTRRLSGGHVVGHAANAKFAHRLRSPDLNQHTSDTETSNRPTSSTGAGKIRRSLPPPVPSSTTMMSGGLKPLHTATLATATATTTSTNKPAWNSGLSTSTTARRASTPASQVGSIRAARLNSNGSGNGSTSEGRRIPIGRSSMIGNSKTALSTKPENNNENTVKSNDVNGKDKEDGENDEMKNNGEIRKMPSKEDSVVGLWRAFDESKGGIGLGLGLDTPEKNTQPTSIRGRGGLSTRGSISSLRGTNGTTLRGSPTVRGTATRGTTPSIRGSTATPVRGGNTPSIRGGSNASTSSGRVSGKAATVGRGGNMVSSRKRDLGGRI